MSSKSQESSSRRDILRKTIGFGSVILGAAWLGIGCKKDATKELSCADTNGLSPQDLQTRTATQYVDKTSNPEQRCDNCIQYKPANPHQCGGCNVIKGPIHPQGYCKLWVKKA